MKLNAKQRILREYDRAKNIVDELAYVISTGLDCGLYTLNDFNEMHKSADKIYEIINRNKNELNCN